MKKYKLLFVLALFLFFLSNAQSPHDKLGKITEAEIKLDKFKDEPDAAAVILTESVMNKIHFDQIIEVHKRIKIFKKEGYKYATIELPYYVGGDTDEKIKDIEGYTYNMEEGVLTPTKLEKKNIFDEKINPYFRMKKIIMPNVKEGSIIEYSYTYKAYIEEIEPWYFQHNIPTLFSECNMLFWEKHNYKEIKQLTHEVKIYEKNQTYIKRDKFNTIRYVLENIPSLKEEKFVNTLRDYQQKVEFFIALNIYYTDENTRMIGDLPSYRDFSKAYSSRYAFDKIKEQIELAKDTVKNILINCKNTKDSAVSVYNWVKKNVKWNGWYWRHPSQSLLRTFTERIGNSADVNLLLIGMLNQVGIKAHPIICSTKEHGKPNKETPLKRKFNNLLAIAEVGKEDICLDAIDPFLPFGMVSFPAHNDEGLVILPDTFVWVTILNHIKPIYFNNATIEIQSDNSLKCSVETSCRGYEANKMRFYAKKDSLETYVKDVFKSELSDNGKLKDFHFDNLYNENETLKRRVEFITNYSIVQNDDYLYITPFLHFNTEKNPFQLNERTYPIDFGQIADEILNFTYIIPEGYEVEDLPKPMRIQWNDKSLKFEYLISHENKKIVINSKVIYKRFFFEAIEYQQIKGFFDNIVTQHSAQIILKKITK